MQLAGPTKPLAFQNYVPPPHTTAAITASFAISKLIHATEMPVASFHPIPQENPTQYALTTIFPLTKC